MKRWKISGDSVIWSLWTSFSRFLMDLFQSFSFESILYWITPHDLYNLIITIFYWNKHLKFEKSNWELDFNFIVKVNWRLLLIYCLIQSSEKKAEQETINDLMKINLISINFNGCTCLNTNICLLHSVFLF